MDIAFVYGAYLLAAFLLAFGAVMVTGMVLHAGHRHPEGFLIYFFAPLMLVILLDPILSMRNLELGLVGAAAKQNSSAAVNWLQRGISLFLLAAAVERVANLLFNQRRHAVPVSLMLTFAICWVCTVGLPAAFGARPAISHEYFYWLLIGLGAFVTTEEGAKTAIRVARNAMFVFCLAGLVMLGVKRNMVLEPYIGGLVTAFPWRYSGLAVGPNQMGPLTLLFMICLSCFPFRLRAVNLFAWGVALMSLLLTQSKTAWLAAMACFTVIWLVRWRGRWSQWLGDPRYRLAVQAWLVMAALGLLAVILVLASGVLDAKLARFLDTRAGRDIMNFTGRGEIWAAAWQTFLNDPWFGYGPTIWDPLFQFQIGMNVFHAHNQVLNVLASAGIVGLLGFTVFMVALLRQIFANFAALNGFVAGLATVVLLRCISEVPFNFQSFASEALMPALLMIAVAGAASRSPARPDKKSQA
ncbi:O-antigen ligase family protein [Roseateles sp.]|uniref:O-antigen ligase family protein n=1 Tax=Roseateles sp. TaxID=1971397 RepID=UPI0039ED3BD3